MVKDINTKEFLVQDEELLQNVKKTKQEFMVSLKDNLDEITQDIANYSGDTNGLKKLIHVFNDLKEYEEKFGKENADRVYFYNAGSSSEGTRVTANSLVPLYDIEDKFSTEEKISIKDLVKKSYGLGDNFEVLHKFSEEPLNEQTEMPISKIMKYYQGFLNSRETVNYIITKLLAERKRVSASDVSAITALTSFYIDCKNKYSRPMFDTPAVSDAYRQINTGLDFLSFNNPKFDLVDDYAPLSSTGLYKYLDYALNKNEVDYTRGDTILTSQKPTSIQLMFSSRGGSRTLSEKQAKEVIEEMRKLYDVVSVEVDEDKSVKRYVVKYNVVKLTDENGFSRDFEIAFNHATQWWFNTIEEINKKLGLSQDDINSFGKFYKHYLNFKLNDKKFIPLDGKEFLDNLPEVINKEDFLHRWMMSFDPKKPNILFDKVLKRPVGRKEIAELLQKYFYDEAVLVDNDNHNKQAISLTKNFTRFMDSVVGCWHDGYGFLRSLTLIRLASPTNYSTDFYEKIEEFVQSKVNPVEPMDKQKRDDREIVWFMKDFLEL